MGKKSPAPPPAPDYAGAAQQQGIANLEAARLTARLSNPNVITPLGTQTVSWGRPQFNQAAYNAAMADWRSRNQQAPPSTGTPSTTQQPLGKPPVTQPPVSQPPVTQPPAYRPPIGPSDNYMVDNEPFGVSRPTESEFISPMGAGAAGARRQEDYTLPRGGLGGGVGMGNVTLPNGTTVPASYFIGGTAPSGGYTGTEMPTPEMFTDMVDLDTPTIIQRLTPEAQATLEAQQRVEKAFAGLGEKAIGKVGDIYGTTFKPEGLPAQRFGFDYGQLPTAPDLAGMGQFQRGVTAEAMPNAPDITAMGQAGANLQAQGVNYGPAAGQYGMAGAGPAGLDVYTPALAGGQGISQGPSAGLYGFAGGGPAAPGQIAGADLSMAGRVAGGPQAGQYGMAQGYVPAERLQQQIDTSQLAQLPVGAGTTAQQAIMSRVQPQLERDRAALENQLRNQGLTPGGEAYNAEINLFNQRANDLVQQAALQGINLDAQMRAQGFSERQIQTELANQARQAQFGMGTTQAQLANQAVGQNFQQALAAQQAQNQAQAQAFQQQLQTGQFGREAQQMAFQMGQSAQEAQNRAVAQNFAQAQAAQQAANAAQAQAYQQRMGEAEFVRSGQLASFGTQQQAQQMYNQAVQQNMAMGLSAAEAQNRAAQQTFQQQGTAQELRNQALAQNQAAAMQQYQAQLGRQAQGFGQQMDVAGLYNASLAAQQQSALQQAQAAAALQAQGYNQAQGAAAFQNAQRQAALQEQLALRAQPLNEIAAIMGGAQVQMPQFQAYQGADVAAAPIFGATQAAGNFAQQNYANQVAAYNARMGLYGNIAGAAGTAYASDRRLKSNVVRVGTHPLGIGVYEYDIFGERQRGVMADEVEAVMPEAVTTHPTEGYKMVYYGMLT